MADLLGVYFAEGLVGGSEIFGAASEGAEFAMKASAGFEVVKAVSDAIGFTKDSTTMSSRPRSRTPARTRSGSKKRKLTPPPTGKRSRSRGRTMSRSTSASRARTVTPGRNQQGAVIGNDQVQSIATNVLRLDLRKSKKVAKYPKSPWIYKITHNGVHLSATGYQGVGCTLSLITYPQCFTSSGVGYNSEQSYTALMQNNPSLNSTGSTLFTAGRWANNKFVVKDCVVTLDLVNTGTSGAMLDIYLFEAQEDTSKSPVTVWEDMLLKDGYNIAEAAIPTTDTSNGGSLNFEACGVLPSDAKSFKKIWKTVGKQFVNLASASSENIVFNILLNKKIEEAVEVENATTFMRGKSYVFMFVSRGQPGIVKATSNTTTYCNTSIGYIYNVKYNLAPVKQINNGINTAYSAYDLRNNTTELIGQALTQQDVITLD